jgi:hypothetical protein
VNESKASAPNGIRIPAQELESIVISQLCDWLTDSDAIVNALNPDPEQMQNLIADSVKLATDLQENKAEQYQLLRQIIARVEVGSSYVSLFIKASALIMMHAEFTDTTDKFIILRTNVQLKRYG